MKINTYYPYPVLYAANDDYQDSSFQAEVDIENVFGEVKITARFHLQNPEIERLIHSNHCVYLIHVECGYTSYRNKFITTEEEIVINIPADLLRGKVNIHTFIVANTRIENYTNASFNEFFQGETFNLDKGNIMAIADAVEINLYEDPTELLNLPSIVTIMKSKKNEYMHVDMYSDNIVIGLPEKEYELYAANAKSLLKNTILTAVIVPTLVYVFSTIATSSKDDLEGYMWYQVLEKIFADHGRRIDEVGTDSLSPLEAAQMILRKPYKSTFEEIEKFLISRSED